MTDAQIVQAIKGWLAQDPVPGQPQIPYGAQVMVCDFWRRKAALKSEQNRLELRAMHLRETAPLTAWRCRPWEDVQ